MADPSTWPPLTPEAVRAAHSVVKPYIYQTPVFTSKTLNRIASTPNPDNARSAKPVFQLYFKCENLQKIGAFKARGAFHALLQLCSEMGIEAVRKRGVTTHSSGNHAQALALAASTLGIPAHIVMPSVSTPSKIDGMQAYGARAIFSGSTEPERVSVVQKVIAETGAILVPPYNHPDIILGQGTASLELEQQVVELLANQSRDVDTLKKEHPLDAVVTPLGGGGLLAGSATYFSGTPSTRVFGAEPSFQGGDDGRRGLAAGPRISGVRTLTIADGLQTPVGEINWTVISDQNKVSGLFAVTKDQIKAAMKLVLECMKLVIKPSAAVPLAVILFDEEF